MGKALAKNLFDYLDGLGPLPANSMFRIALEDNYLVMYHIKLKIFGGDEIIQVYRINAQDILSLDIAKRAEIENQSVIGRGAVGAILFGPVGAVLGGMSAASKQKVKTVFAISYLPSNDDTPKTVIFSADAAGWIGYNTASVAKLKSEVSAIKKSDRAMRYLGQVVNADGSITL